MRASLIGGGALKALRGGGEGSVLAWFPKACYVSMPAGLVALVAQGVEPGPIHVELDGEPPTARPGARAMVAERGLEVDGWTIGLAGAGEWRGPVPPHEAVRASTERIVEAASGTSRSSPLLAEPFSERSDRSRRLLMTGSLDGAARLLVGVGPGLTPSGDDALAGVLFALRAAIGEGSESSTRLASEIGETSPISRSFLRCAARGQALAPAHDLLASAAAGDREEAARAVGRMAAVGETSGADFLLGLRWGMEAAHHRLRTSGANRRR